MNRTIMKILVNLITLTRLIATIVVLPIFINFGALITGVFLGVVFITDFLDGYLARKFKVQTHLGAILDQGCDKLLSLSSLLCLTTVNPLFIAPLLLETGTMLVNIGKISKGLESNSSMIGRIKMWILGLSTVLGFASAEIISNPEITEIITSQTATDISNVAALVSTGFCASALYGYAKENKGQKKEYSEYELKKFDEIWESLTSTKFKEENPNISKDELIFKRIKKQ